MLDWANYQISWQFNMWHYYSSLIAFISPINSVRSSNDYIFSQYINSHRNYLSIWDPASIIGFKLLCVYIYGLNKSFITVYIYMYNFSIIKDCRKKEKAKKRRKIWEFRSDTFRGRNWGRLQTRSLGYDYETIRRYGTKKVISQFWF